MSGFYEVLTKQDLEVDPLDWRGSYSYFAAKSRSSKLAGFIEYGGLNPGRMALRINMSHPSHMFLITDDEDLEDIYNFQKKDLLSWY